MRSLQQTAQTDFILLEAAWTAAYGLQVLRAARGRVVIVHRLHQGQEYFYVYLKKEALAALRGYPPTELVERVLDLHEFRADQKRNAGEPAPAKPETVVVLDQGRLVGYTHPGVKQTRSAALQGLGTSVNPLDQHLGGEAQPGLLERTLNADFPAGLAVGQEAELKVSLSAGLTAREEAGRSIIQPAGTKLDVIIQARRGLEVVGAARNELVIGSQNEFTPLSFTLRATEAGEGDVRVIVSKEGTVIGYLTLSPLIEAAGGGDARRVAQSQGVAAVEVSNPDLSLFIELKEESGKRGFVTYLSARDLSLNLNMKTIGPVFFQSDPGPYFDGFYRGIEGLLNTSTAEQARTALELEARGVLLFETLFPPEAQQLLWTLKDRIRTVFIQSNEPWVPWELCRLTGMEQGKKVEGEFFCEAFEITRWLPGTGIKPALRLSNLAVVAPDNSGLPYSVSELQYMLGLAAGGPKVTRIPARYLELFNAFSAGDHDGWHFSGHGASRGLDPNNSEMILDQGDTLTPMRISGTAANLGRATPLVFLNACQIGAGGMALTDIGGWARQFLAAGAGAFIGAQWSILDRTAFFFTKELYSRLLQGHPVGRAVRLARLAVKPAGNSTWLAYTVFAHPLAVVKV